MPASARSDRNRLCERFLNTGILVLLVFTPLAFGAVHVWAFSLMEMSIFFLVLIWAGHTLWGRYKKAPVPASSLSCNVYAVLPFALFLCLAVFQLLPLPPGLLSTLSPATYQLYQTVLPGWPHQESFPDLGEVTVQRLAPATATPSEPGTEESLFPHPSSPWRPLSLYAPASRLELLKLLAYSAFFALVASKGSPLLIMFSLVTLGTGLALLAFLQQATWNGKLLWFFVPQHWSGPRPGNEGPLHGPFVNPDHFAGSLEMILPLAVAAMLVCGRQVWQHQKIGRRRNFSLSAGITQTVATLSSPSAFFCGLCVLATIVILTALVFTMSRGGFSAAFASLFFMAWLLWPRPQSSVLSPQSSSVWAKLGRVACILGFLSVPLLYLAQPQIFSHFLRLPQQVETTRLAVYTATLALWRDFPIWGVGLGNFQEVFSLYHPPAVGQVFYNYTHNDYLQLLAETGILGFGLSMWGIAGVLYRAARSWRWTIGAQRVWFAGVLAGIVAMLLHSVVDFNLHIPANALLFVTLLALSVRLGQDANVSEDHYGSRSRVSVASGDKAIRKVK